VSQLPWEFLYDRRLRDYVSLSVPIARYPQLMRPITTLAVEPPLRILGVAARPYDRDQLDVAREQHDLIDALGGLGTGRVQLRWLDGESWQALKDAVRREPWHVLHFVGHGGFDSETGEGYLDLVRRDGTADHVSATDFCHLLQDNHSLRVVVLNACESGRAASGDPLSSIAATLMTRGIPSVVAMQYEISDPAALTFADAFYRALADNLPLDRAVTDARGAVKREHRSLEWGTPVLYLRSPQTRIFESVPSAAATPSVQPVPPPVQPVPPPVQPVPPPVQPPVRPTHAWTGNSTAGGALAGGPAVPEPASGGSGILGDVVRAFRPNAQAKARIGGWLNVVDPLRSGAGSRDFAAPRRPARSVPGDPTQGPAEALVALAEISRLQHQTPVRTIVFSPDRGLLAVGCEDGTIPVWNTATARVVLAFRHNIPLPGVNKAAWTADGRYLGAAYRDGSARIWNPATEVADIAVRPSGLGTAWSVVFSPDGRWLAVAGNDQSVRILDTSGREFTRLVHLAETRDAAGRRLIPKDVMDVAFSPDGSFLATAASDGIVRIWNPQGAVVTRLRHPEAVNSVAFDGDGRRIVTGCADGVVRVWGGAAAAIVARVRHTGSVRAAAFAPNGRWLVSGSDDHNLVVSDSTGIEIARARHEGTVTAAGHHPNGHMIASASSDRTVRLWLPPVPGR
jgi:WD40 repeat protein